MYRLLLFALALPAWCYPADISLQVVRHGERFEVEAVADFEADAILAWEVLTDYDGLSTFIPGMQTSRIVSRSQRGVVVEQSGEARLLFFSFPIQVRLEIEEFPHERIVSRAVEGNFKEMSGAYTLETQGRRVLLRYSGSLIPGFSIPPLIGTILLRNTMEKRFGAMVHEIVRRQQLRGFPAEADPGSGS